MLLAGAVVAFVLVSPERFEASYPVPIGDEWVGSGPVADPDATCPGVGQRVCILAIGSPHTADVDIDALAAYFEDTYDLPITVLPPIDLAGMEHSSGELVDHQRKQLKADVLLEQLKTIYPALWAETQVTLVAVTPHDIFDARDPDLEYLYSVRATRPGRFVVVSSARMDDAAWGDTAGDATIAQRTRKLVARELGALHFGLNFSDDPTSVMAGVFGSRARIDRVNERLPLEQLLAQRPELIARDTIKTFNGDGRGGTGIFEVEPGAWDYCGLISATPADGNTGVRLSLYTEAGAWLTSASGKGSAGSLPCIGFTGPGRFEVRGYAVTGVAWSVSVGPRDAVQPEPPLLPIWDTDATIRWTPVSTADGVVTFDETEGGWTPWFRPNADAWSLCWEAYAVPNPGRVTGQNEYLSISVLLEQEWDHLAEWKVATPQPGGSGCFQIQASQPNGRHWIFFNDAADLVGFRYTLEGVELAN